MSNKLDKKEEAAGLQYIKTFLVPKAAMEWSLEWEPIAQAILKDLHRIDADVPILGKQMTDLLFYKAEIFGWSGAKKKSGIIFRIGKYAGRTVVSYYDELSESKWYGINEKPEQSVIKRITEVDEDLPIKQNKPKEEPITKLEEQEALQFIRNVAIPYTVDNIYSTFLAFHSIKMVDYPKITADELRNNLKKISHAPYVILYETKITNRTWFTYYIQKLGSSGVRVLIHHQLPMPNSYKTQDVILYLDKGKHPHWFKQLGYIKETHMGPDEHSDVTKREESQAVQWIRDHIFKYVAKQIGTTEEQLRNTFKKIGHTNNIWYASQSGLPNFPEVIFGIYRNEKDQIMISVDNEPAWHIDFPVGSREYLSDFGSIHENQRRFPGESQEAYINRMVKISPKEEAEGLYFIKNFLFKKASDSWNASMTARVSKDLSITLEELAKNFKKTERRYIPPERYLEPHAHEKITYVSHIDREYYVDVPHSQKILSKKGLIFTFYTIKDDDGKLVVCFVLPSRNDAGSCWGIDHLIHDKPNLKESTEKIHRISKKEELEALQYIRRILGPYAIGAWNQRTLQHQFEPGMVIKQLKKIVDQRQPADIKMATKNTDYIKYSTVIPVRDVTLDHKVFFTFSIYKNHEDKVVVKYETPLIDGGPFVVGTSPMTGNWMIRENTENPRKAINKMDEYRAVDFIKKLIVPLAVKRWNRIYIPHGDLSIDKVLKSMKKTEYNTGRILSDSVIYISKTTIPNVMFHWEIWKDNNGKLMVGWKVSTEQNLWATYYVDNPSPVDESIGSDLASKYSVNKKEETYAADFIKKRLIPKLVQFINDTNKHYTRHRQITIEEVLKTFKKIAVFDSKYGYRREIQYQALFLGEPFVFDIFKDGNSKLKVLQNSDGTSHFVT